MEDKLEEKINKNIEKEARVLSIKTMNKMDDTHIEVLRILKENDGRLKIDKLTRNLENTSASGIMIKLKLLEKLDLIKIKDSRVETIPDVIIFKKSLN